MLDFTSAKYLGFDHPSRSLGSWARLTSGRPAIIERDAESAALERAIARTTRLPAALLATSSLHALWDVIALMMRMDARFFVEDGTYPITLAALAQARGRGRAVLAFGHHDPDDLERALQRGPGRPVIVADGVCPTCGRVAPLDWYARAARERGGLLVIDDTQGVGLVGPQGGGSAAVTGADPSVTVVVASLSKALAAPLAFTAGPEWLIADLRENGAMRASASPPNTASVRAARAALRLNERVGDDARRRLASNILAFRRATGASTFEHGSHVFPVQSLRAVSVRDALRANRALSNEGIRTIVTTARCPPRAALLTFLLTAAHRGEDVARAAAAAAEALGRTRDTHSRAELVR